MKGFIEVNDNNNGEPILIPISSITQVRSAWEDRNRGKGYIKTAEGGYVTSQTYSQLKSLISQSQSEN